MYGSVLGDGYLTPQTKKKQYSYLRLKYDDKYLSYIRWLHNELKPLGTSQIKVHTGYHQHLIDTQSSAWLGDVRKIFYPNGKKIIPDTIKKLIVDPNSIAVWYMDDGSLDFRDRYHYNSTFATYCFSYDNFKDLSEVLLENFGIYTSVHKSTMRNVEYYRIYVLSRSMNDFIKLVKPYIQTCFSYKISL